MVNGHVPHFEGERQVFRAEFAVGSGHTDHNAFFLDGGVHYLKHGDAVDSPYDVSRLRIDFDLVGMFQIGFIYFELARIDMRANDVGVVSVDFEPDFFAFSAQQEIVYDFFVGVGGRCGNKAAADDGGSADDAGGNEFLGVLL